MKTDGRNFAPIDTSDTTNHMWTTLGLMQDLSYRYFLDTYEDLKDNTVDCSLHQSAESNRTVAKLMEEFNFIMTYKNIVSSQDLRLLQSCERMNSIY